MTKLGDIVTSIALGDGETVVVKFEPSADIGETAGAQGGRTFHVPVVLENGKKAILKGGVRLIDALQAVVGDATSTLGLRVVALGKPGSTARDWRISREK